MAESSGPLEDPVLSIVPKALCSECGSPLGGCRVHEGSKPENAHRRGTIVQTCSGDSCWKTVYLTQAYNYDDATELLGRLRQRLAFPDQELPPQSRLRASAIISPTRSQVVRAPPASQHPAGGSGIHCSTGCVTQAGRPKVANAQCVDTMCSECCRSTAQIAIQNNRARAGCKTHKQPAVEGRAGSSHQPQPTHARIPPPTGTSPVRNLPVPGPSQVRDVPPPPPPPSQAHRPRELAQPIHPDWSASFHQADDEKRQRESLKAKNRRLEQGRKRTVELVFYHMNGNDPITIEHVVDTYPTLCLDDIEYIADFGLGDKSWIDVFVDGGFKSYQIRKQSSIQVERGREVLIRLRPSLREPLTDCPGIERYIAKQASARTSLGKRQGDALVSPLKLSKAPRLSTGSSTSEAPIDTFSAPTRSPSPDIFQVASTQSQAQPPATSSSHHSHSRKHKSDKMSKSKGKGKAKRKWPFHFYMSEIVSGLHRLKQMKDNKRKSKIEDNFGEVFSGAKFPKTTFYNSKKLVESASNAVVVGKFVALGETDDALWPQFLEEVERSSGKRRPKESELEDELSDESDTASPSRSASQPSDIDQDSDSDDYLKPVKYLRCAYCDERLPSVQSEILVAMGDELKAKTIPDPVSWNKNHRKATDFTVYQDYCARHRFELDDLPRAHLENWPEDPDLSSLNERLCQMKPDLLRLVATATLEKNDFFTAAKKTYEKVKRTRADTAEVMFAKWKDHGAGYYGDEGSAIMNITLTALFPEFYFDCSKEQPLSHQTLIREVFVREAAVRLIQQDLAMDRASAVITHSKSHRFGSMHHPGEDSDLVLEATKWASAYDAQPDASVKVKVEPDDGFASTSLGDMGMVEDGFVARQTADGGVVWELLDESD